MDRRVVTVNRFQRGPAHQLRTLFGDLAAHHLGIGLAVTGRQPSPRAQRFRRSESIDVSDLGDEDRCDGAPTPSRAWIAW